MTDQEALDAIAAYLGTQESWNGGDVCEFVANVIGRTGRPHPGSDLRVGGAAVYGDAFKRITGRDIPAEYDLSEVS